MKLFFAASPSKKHIRLLNKCNVENFLISYNFVRKPELLIRLMGDFRPKNMIIDSGAFSVWSNGGTININEYITFCKTLKKILPKEINLFIVNLDVLPGKFGETPTSIEREASAKQGWANMLKLEKAGLKVIHVFHQHEPWEWLEKMRKHSDYIGISPANDASMTEKHNWLNQVFTRIKDTIKTHGFAVTSHTQLYKYPFYSTDSSSWVAPARFGRIPIFTDDLKLKSIQYKNKNHIIEYWQYLSKLGIESLSSDDWQMRTELSIRSFQNLEKVATRLWASRGVIFKDELQSKT